MSLEADVCAKPHLVCWRPLFPQRVAERARSSCLSEVDPALADTRASAPTVRQQHPLLLRSSPEAMQASPCDSWGIPGILLSLLSPNVPVFVKEVHECVCARGWVGICLSASCLSGSDLSRRVSVSFAHPLSQLLPAASSQLSPLLPFILFPWPLAHQALHGGSRGR